MVSYVPASPAQGDRQADSDVARLYALNGDALGVLMALGTLDRAVTPDLAVPRVRRPQRAIPRGIPRTGRVIVVIPAHNEAASIGKTLRSLRYQTRLPEQVMVVCDNCTDDTAAIAAQNGAQVMRTLRNAGRKAGALNQSLSLILPAIDDEDFVLTMDADSQLSRNWIKEAAEALDQHRNVGAVCGMFLGEAGHGLIGQLQRNEYFRYARYVRRHKQVRVLSGTGTLFRVRALREIARERDNRLPGRHGQYYDPTSITEDNEITLAMKTVGYQCWVARGCYTLTEVMPTWRDLFRQRLRWQKGTLSDLRHYGVTSVTAGYWMKQVVIYAAVLASIVCWLIISLSLGHHLGIDLPWTAAILSVALLERTITVRKAGLRGTLLAALVIPEFAYDIFRLTFFLRALLDDLLLRDITWNHVVKDAAQDSLCYTGRDSSV